MSLARLLAAALTCVLPGACAAEPGKGEADAGVDAAAGLGIGQACADSSECESGDCAGAGVCTAACTMHADCGCPHGVTNSDLLEGRCEVGCMESVCVRVCQSQIDCAGATECYAGDVWDGCL